MHPSSPTSPRPSPSSRAEPEDPAADRFSPQLWRELLTLSQGEVGERLAMERLLDHWRRSHSAESAALYLERRDALEQQACSGSDLPEILDADGAGGDGLDLGNLQLPGGWLIWSPAGAGGAVDVTDPLPVLFAAFLKTCRLKLELKEQQFQVNYRVVELENLYDVGLAVAGTLDLDRLAEEILLRAVSLLDARRGALYILDDHRYRLERTFGGDAGRWFSAEDPHLAAFLSGNGHGNGEMPPPDLLPGARYLLGVPILFENSPLGLVVVGDKESRRGVGPFLPGDRRTLGLFANQAAIALENARLHLRALEQERLEREMHLAAEIQRQILPKGAPQVAGCQLAGWNRPARQVGGDYYDMFPTRDGRIGLVVGDVSGKGIPAALMVSTLHSALRLLLDQTGIGPPLLEKLNRHILESSMPNKFITMFLAELDPESGHLLYVNAGHNPGLLLRRNGHVEELGSGGVPLGLLPGSRYLAREVVIEPGDLLCLYSDGITEAESVEEEEFGTERLCDVLRAHHGARAIQAVVDSIHETVEVFTRGQPQGDDQTLLVLRREDAYGVAPDAGT